MLSRRLFLGGLGGTFALDPVLARAAAPVVADDLWRGWVDGLVALQDNVVRRGWTLDRFAIDPPASEDEVARLEERHEVHVPAQLRAVLTGRAAGIGIGWSIPRLMRPLEGLDLPSTGGLGPGLWDLAHIDEKAIPAFARMRKSLAQETDAEQPNTPDMWDNQFPWAALDNGDMLTIDVSSPDGPQPVRYFSDDLEGLHHRILAPDFFGFVSAYIRLGCAGNDQDDWYRFVDDHDGRAILDPESEGGRRWLAWLARDPARRDPDEPPPAVPAKTASDFDLLDAGRVGSRWGIRAALAAGAVPDCVDGNLPNRQGVYDTTFETALILALRRRDRAAAEDLLGAGAALDTRLLALSEAVRTGTVDLVRWLLGRGARANGWKGQRYWPIHVLLTQPADKREGGSASTVPMLEALLGAGADPNARWDGGRTMLMWTGVEPMRVLLDHGADPKLYDADGDTALHLARSAEAVRLLAAHGADVNALTRPPDRHGGVDGDPPHTPYQALSVFAGSGTDQAAILGALVKAGADPLRRDGAGRGTLWYCSTVAAARRVIGLGGDPRERSPDGRTLLFGIVRYYGEDFAKSTAAVALFTFYLGLGLDINAPDRVGSTVLGFAAERSGPESIAFLLKHGADKTLRDKQGRLPIDRVPAAKPAVREVLAG